MTNDDTADRYSAIRLKNQLDKMLSEMEETK